MVVWKVMAYLEQRFIGGRGCWYLNGVELLLEFGPVVVYVRHCDHDTGRRGEGRPSVVPDRHLKTKIKFLRIKCEIFLFRVCAMWKFPVFSKIFKFLCWYLLEIYYLFIWNNKWRVFWIWNICWIGGWGIFIRKFLHKKIIPVDNFRFQTNVIDNDG